MIVLTTVVGADVRPGAHRQPSIHHPRIIARLHSAHAVVFVVFDARSRNERNAAEQLPCRIVGVHDLERRACLHGRSVMRKAQCVCSVVERIVDADAGLAANAERSRHRSRIVEGELIREPIYERRRSAARQDLDVDRTGRVRWRNAGDRILVHNHDARGWNIVEGDERITHELARDRDGRATNSRPHVRDDRADDRRDRAVLGQSLSKEAP
jgi:hypothetical protein